MSNLPLGLSNPKEEEIRRQKEFHRQQQLQQQQQQQQNYSKRQSQKLQKRKSQKQNGVEVKLVKPKINEDDIRQNEVKEELGEQSIEYAIFAFYDSEKEYVKTLTNLSNEQKRLTLMVKQGRNPPLQEKDIHKIFGSIQNIAKTSQSFLDNLTKVLVQGLSEKLGQEVEKMVPYLKMYGVYVDDIKPNLNHLRTCYNKHRKFKEYADIIKELYGSISLETMLQEPMKRLPFYLQLLANIYAAYVENKKQNSPGGKCLYSALVAIKKLIDEIAIKTRDKKARMFCAVLQKNLFKNKLKLSEPYRMVYRTGKLHFLRKGGNRVESGFLILCNDIILITSHPKRGAKLHGVLPTYHARVIKDCKLSPKLKLPKECGRSHFALMCQNRAYNPEKDDFLYVIFFVRDEKQNQIWVQAIDSAIDEEEHNLHPTNPVDLEARLLKKDTSLEGASPQLDIKDPNMIAQIQQWRKNRDNGIIGRRGFISKYAPEMEIEKNKLLQLQRQNTAPTLPLSSSESVQQNSNNYYDNSNNHISNNNINNNRQSHLKKNKTSPNLLPGPPPVPNVNNNLPPVPNIHQNGYPGPPPMKSAPKVNRPPPNPYAQPNIKPPPVPYKNMNNGHPKPPPFNMGQPPNTQAPPPRKKDLLGGKPRRKNLLAGIQKFNKQELSSAPVNNNRRISVQQDMQDILKDTISGYRKFVMDENDDDDEDEVDPDEWI